MLFESLSTVKDLAISGNETDKRDKRTSDEADKRDQQDEWDPADTQGLSHL